MPGDDERSGDPASCVDTQTRARRDYPLQVVREIINTARRNPQDEFAAL